MVPRIYEHFYAQRVFDIEEVKPLFPDVQQARNALHYARTRKYIKRIKGGLYTVVPFDARGDDTAWEAYAPDLFLIGSRIIEPYMFSHLSALAIYGLVEYRPNRFMITSPKRFKPFAFQGADYLPVHTSNFFGARTVYYKEELPVQVSDFEKTFLDCLQRFDLAGGVVGFYRALWRFGFLNPPKLIDYLEHYPSQAFRIRVGFTLWHMRERWDIPQSLLNPLLDEAQAGGPWELDRSLPQEMCELEPVWNLWIPQNFRELSRPVG
jgi:predicted transcriptional regulator of viral defense system